MRDADGPGATIAPAVPGVLGRTRHYAEFFGEQPLPEWFGLVVGNCQAESLRIVMDAPGRRFIRVPPVHELDAGEAQRLTELVRRADAVVSQPIRDDYRGLPVGTRQLAELSTRRPVTVTPIRFGGIHPYQAAIRVPGVDGDPPIVAYHDVRTILAALGRAARSTLSPEEIREIGRATIDELRTREARTDVSVADLFDTVTADHMRTVNHPGNPVFAAVGARLLAALSLDGPVTDPGRPLLASVRAPLLAEVIDAWGLADAPRTAWVVDGVDVDDADVRAAHLAWYAQHPRFLAVAQDRLAPLLTAWAAA